MAQPPRASPSEWKAYSAFWRAVRRIETDGVSAADVLVQIRELADDYGGYDNRMFTPLYAAFDK